MYGADDPRSRLAHTTRAPRSLGPASPAECIVLSDVAAQPEGVGIDSWYIRGQNFIVNHVAAQPDATLTRNAQPDEYVVLITDPAMGVRITTAGETVEVWGPSLTIVPPGDSSVHALAPGAVTRLLTASSTDLLALCVNADSYVKRKANVTEFGPWPEPVDGYRVRTYSLDVPDEPGRFGRIWRCSTFMINVLAPNNGPRDPQQLSPHTHDDFEQGSIGVEGVFVHHLRWAWGTDRTEWRDDLHLTCPSPSVTVIPPPALHTTEAIGAGVNQLVDVFCPPRHDFSKQSGWVLNAAEYPEPVDSN